MTIQQLLIKYWGHKNFRALQENIITSVLEGKDTLALLPTGGGKSVCYQLPAIAMDGICLVISPLIALMKDQVQKLTQKEIKAISIHSGMHPSEIDIAFDNCIYGDVKLLYLSPERLLSDLAIARIKKMKINLIAVDEAHCISQWGYNFRPPYLKIAEIRQYFPDVPVLALTATATADVIKDIQIRLKFRKENVLSTSFERKNLIYNVYNEPDKLQKIIKILKDDPGQGLIYVRSRLRTSEISDYINRTLAIENQLIPQPINVSNPTPAYQAVSTYYHAGLENKIRSKRQDEWMNGKTRIIVCTSAFGMGIDKPDVRFVIHYDPADTIEEYYQQAGRAGRDGKKAYAVLLFNESDKQELEKNHLVQFPGIDKIKAVYHALGNYYNIPVGNGKDVSFDFDIKDFCNNYNLETLETYNCLKFIEKEGYIMLFENVNTPSRIHFLLKKDELYNYQVANPNMDNFIKLILRNYSGVFNDFQNIYESDLAIKSNTTKENIIKLLQILKRQEIIDYLPQKNKPQIVYCEPRIASDDIYISKEVYNDRKKIAEIKMKAFINYATNSHKCRSQQLLFYFEDKNSTRCGNCDVCIKRNQLQLSEFEFDIISDRIKPLMQQNPMTLTEIKALFENIDDTKILKVISWLLDNNKIKVDKENKYFWK